MISKNELDTIKKFFSHEPVELVYLFGSQATGDIHSWSDEVDTVEVLDLNSAPVYFKYSAIAPQQDVYVADEQKRIDFEKRTLSSYFDRLPYLKRHTLQSLSTIAKEGL